MKTKFSRILGVGLTLALLTSLLLTAAPVSADVSSATVTPSVTTISKKADYTIVFKVNKDLTGATQTITVVLPSGTDASAIADTNGDVQVQNSVGLWGGVANGLTNIAAAQVTVATDKRTVTIDIAGTALLAGDILEGANVKIATTATEIVNPSTAGSYNLTVATSAETVAVPSAAYTIKDPTPSALPGIVQLCNPTGTVMENYTGASAIQDALNDAGESYIVKIGPGTYANALNTTVAKVTLVATGFADETVVTGDWTIDEASIVVDSLTLKGTLTVTGDKVTIKNCALAKKDDAAETLVVYNNATAGASSITSCTFDTTTYTQVDTAVDVQQAGLTVSGCSFTLDSGDTAVSIGANATVKDCPSITGTGGIGVATTTGTATISGSIFDGLATALSIGGGTISVTKNTIMNSTGDAVSVSAATTKVTITGNDISATAATKYALAAAVGADAETIFALFNNITGNTLNVNNLDTTNTLTATHNWWGVETGPASTSISGLVSTSGYLISAATPGAGAIATAAASLTAKTTAGVDVSTNATAGNEPAVIGATMYATNPAAAAPPYTALADGYFDVYISDAGDATSATIKLYGDVTADTEAYVWNALGGAWVKCTTQSVNTFGGYVYVTASSTIVPSIADLAGLPFVLVAKPATAVVLATPTLLAPATGADDVALTPTLAWSAVSSADGYYLELADNANFVLPMVKLDGDLGRLVVTAYNYITALPYSTPYYWRVKAVSGTVAAGTLLESSWATSVFLTMAEPVEPTPPVVIEEAPDPVIPPTPIIEPIVEVITPAAEMITPSWIYIIIGVGGVLVIAMIVLIVRTRRVA